VSVIDIEVTLLRGAHTLRMSILFIGYREGLDPAAMRLDLLNLLPQRTRLKGVWRKAMTAKRILVPLDGSESAETAAVLAATLARSGGGSVRLLRVSPVPKQWVGDYGRVVVYADQEMERLTAEGRHYLETVGAQLPAVPIESVVRFGKPAEEILAEAEAFGADAWTCPGFVDTWVRLPVLRGCAAARTLGD